MKYLKKISNRAKLFLKITANNIQQIILISIPREQRLNFYENIILKNSKKSVEYRGDYEKYSVDKQYQIIHPTEPNRVNIETITVCNANCVFCKLSI